MIDRLVHTFEGKRCLVLGAAPLRAPLSVDVGEVVLAVNGGISSCARCDLWVLNTRAENDPTVAGDKRRLHQLMLAQGKGRTVGQLLLLVKADGGVKHTIGVLDRQQTDWQLEPLEVNVATRREIEIKSGARTPDLERHAISAGMFAAAACLLGGAVSVRLEGFSWSGGYAYAPDVVVPRGHEYGDKRALAALVARYGARISHALPLSPKEIPVPPATTKFTPAASPAPAAPRRSLKVRATELCFYDNARRREGEVFVLRSEKHFKKSHMEWVAPTTPVGAPPSKATQVSSREHIELQRGRIPALQPNAADPVAEPEAPASGGPKVDEVI